jgi:hypothetical protein
MKELGKLGKDLTKQDHIFTMEGTRNSLDKCYYYLIEKELSFVAERTVSTNVRFVNLFSSKTRRG